VLQKTLANELGETLKAQKEKNKTQTPLTESSVVACTSWSRARSRGVQWAPSSGGRQGEQALARQRRDSQRFEQRAARTRREKRCFQQAHIVARMPRKRNTIWIVSRDFSRSFEGASKSRREAEATRESMDWCHRSTWKRVISMWLRQ